MHMLVSGLAAVLVPSALTLVAAAPQPKPPSRPLQVRADDFPPSQPIPQLLKDNPDLFYWPNIKEPGALTQAMANQSDGIVNPQDGNWFGTGLFGYDECKKRGLNKAKIDDAYYDMYYLANSDGVKKDIDWNSAAALEYLGPPLNNKDYQEHIQKMLFLASETWKSWGTPAIHHIHVRCDDPAKQCFDGCNPDGTPKQSDTIAYTQQDDGKGYTSMNFCPRFFDMPRLRTAAIDHGKNLPVPDNVDIQNYENTAHVFLHELLHADYFMSNGPLDHVYDLQMKVRTTKGTETVDVYGAMFSKIMARFAPIHDPLIRQTGWYTSHNSDNMAYFATAKYVQDEINLYPHLPVVYSRPVGTPTLPPRRTQVLTFNNVTDANFDFEASNFTATAGPDTCINTLGSDGKTEGPVIEITGLADDSAYPADYIKQRDQWIADVEKGGDNPTTTTTATSTTATSTAQPTCTGNQVQGDCKTNFLPPEPPFSGPQAPSCAKADGSPGSAARLNEEQAMTGATQYCEQLARDKVKLGKDGSNPKPAILQGLAENKKDMVMTVMFYETACPTDKKTDSLDFATYDQKKCVDGFAGILSQVCAQDSTWQAYNKDFTVMGGVWGNDCALWSLQSQ